MPSFYEDSLKRPGKKSEYDRQIAALVANQYQQVGPLPNALTQAGSTAPSVLNAALSRRPQQPLTIPTLGPAAVPAPATVPLQNAAAVAPVLQRPTFNNVQATGSTGPDYQRSNAPGTAIINGKVVSKDRIAALAGPNTGAASAGTYAPEPTPVLQRPQGPLNGLNNPAEAARFAQSDLNSIATGDFRSAAGLAARNARVDAEATPTRIGTTNRERADIRQGNINQASAAIGALSQNALQQPALAADRATQQARSADLATQQAGDTTRALIGADATVAAARLTRPGNQQDTITLEDGTLAQVGQNGLSRPVLGPDGKPVRQQQGKPPTDQVAYAKLFSENYNRVLGADPVSGLVVDAANPKGRKPTPEELQRANTAAKSLTLDALGTGNTAGGSGQVFVDANGNRARLVNGQYIPE